ncbi:MAG: N-acetyltransferase [bacterium]
MIRKARINEALAIRDLINSFAQEGLLLSLSLSDIYDRLRDFFVYEQEGDNSANKIVGVCALHIIWENLAEIRSLAVNTEYQKKGIGKSLVKSCLKEATDLGIKKVFCLTYNREFFSLFGFRNIDKSELPHKIWADCLKCSKFPECTETAMIFEI